MNPRELCVAAIVESVATIRKIRKVAREPQVLEEQAVTSFPCVILESTNESRTNISFGSGRANRQGVLDVVATLHVLGTNRDQQRNELIAAIESVVVSDTSLGGVATDTQLVLVETLPIDAARPYATARLTFQVVYCYSQADLI